MTVFKDSISFHDHIASEWSRAYRRPTLRSRVSAIDCLLQRASIEGRAWLDAGCGSGILTELLLTRGARAIGVDASGKMIQQATSFIGDHPNVSFELISTVEDIDLETGSMDGVLCSSVLEYVSAPRECLMEFARVLRPGGVLIASVPNKQSPVRLVHTAAYHMTNLVGRPRPLYIRYSKHSFSRHGFGGLLNEVGFNVETYTSCGGFLMRFPRFLPAFEPLHVFLARRR